MKETELNFVFTADTAQGVAALKRVRHRLEDIDALRKRKLKLRKKKD